jgi:type IV secretion system protein VirB5
MQTLRVVFVSACMGASVLAAPVVHAQWAVVDAPAIVQLIQEVQTMEEQLQTARSQLAQAQQALQSMTGNRGMQQLLSGTVRNYLPSDWAQLPSMSGVPQIVSANAILTPQRLTQLPTGAQQWIQATRQWTAVRQAVARQALTNAGNRFSAIQSLIAAIPAAADQKGILDLQARISAELGMLQNEQIKLQVLNQTLDAQDSMLRQQARELVVEGHGNFASRFQPVP